MKGHGTKFARKKEEAIAALLTHRTVEEAAKAVGISTNTLLRWQRLPEFEVAYRLARRSMFAQAAARLQQAAGTAVSVLLRVMVDASTPPAAKIRAADSVLDHAARAIELEDIEARLAELERIADKAKHGKN